MKFRHAKIFRGKNGIYPCHFKLMKMLRARNVKTRNWTIIGAQIVLINVVHQCFNFYSSMFQLLFINYFNVVSNKMHQIIKLRKMKTFSKFQIFLKSFKYFQYFESFIQIISSAEKTQCEGFKCSISFLIIVDI